MTETIITSSQSKDAEIAEVLEEYYSPHQRTQTLPGIEEKTERKKRLGFRGNSLFSSKKSSTKPSIEPSQVKILGQEPLHSQESGKVIEDANEKLSLLYSQKSNRRVPRVSIIDLGGNFFLEVLDQTYRALDTNGNVQSPRLFGPIPDINSLSKNIDDLNDQISQLPEVTDNDVISESLVQSPLVQEIISQPDQTDDGIIDAAEQDVFVDCQENLIGSKHDQIEIHQEELNQLTQEELNQLTQEDPIPEMKYQCAPIEENKDIVTETQINTIDDTKHDIINEPERQVALDEDANPVPNDVITELVPGTVASNDDNNETIVPVDIPEQTQHDSEEAVDSSKIPEVEKTINPNFVIQECATQPENNNFQRNDEEMVQLSQTQPAAIQELNNSSKSKFGKHERLVNMSLMLRGYLRKRNVKQDSAGDAQLNNLMTGEEKWRQPLRSPSLPILNELSPVPQRLNSLPINIDSGVPIQSEQLRSPIPLMQLLCEPELSKMFTTLSKSSLFQSKSYQDIDFKCGPVEVKNRVVNDRSIPRPIRKFSNKSTSTNWIPDLTKRPNHTFSLDIYESSHRPNRQLSDNTLVNLERERTLTWHGDNNQDNFKILEKECIIMEEPLDIEDAFPLPPDAAYKESPTITTKFDPDQVPPQFRFPPRDTMDLRKPKKFPGGSLGRNFISKLRA